jgi:hypothetical protein
MAEAKIGSRPLMLGFLSSAKTLRFFPKKRLAAPQSIATAKCFFSTPTSCGASSNRGTLFIKMIGLVFARYCAEGKIFFLSLSPSNPFHQLPSPKTTS